MKFSSVLTTALTFGLTLASPIEFAKRQDANTLVSRINAVGTAITRLNSTLNTLRPRDPVGFAKALQVQQQSGQLETAIKDATASANAIPAQLDQAGSEAVAVAVLDLFPFIQQVLNNIVTKKPAFATAFFGFGDLSRTVRASLVSQRGLTVQLGDAIPPKLTEDLAAIAPGIIAEILTAFDTAIAAYDNCSSRACLPPFPNFFPSRI